MNDQKILEVLKIYEKYFSNSNSVQAILHLSSMIPKMKNFLQQNRRDKVFRWLGFMQGVLWTKGIFTLEQLKNHNRPDKEDNMNN
jgi:hypothetical protein